MTVRAAALLALTVALGCARAPRAMDLTPELRLYAPTPRARLVLEAGAADLDPAVRRQALAALVYVDPAPAGGPWGARGAMDPDPYVVRSVMLALGARSDAESRAVLTSVATDVRRECGIRGRAALILRSPGPDDCFAGLLASAAAGAAGAGEALAGVVRAGDLPLELDLLRALGRANVPPVGPALAEAVPRAEDTVRLAGAAALLDYDVRAARAVLEPALRSNDPDEALEAVELLDAHQSARADDVLRAVAGSSTVAGRVAEMILFARGEGRVSRAFDALGDPDREVRAAACRALAARLRVDPDRAGGERARVALRERLRAADPVVQAAAIGSMDATLDADRAALDALLDHEDPATRVRAAARLTGVDQVLEAGVPPR